jgi:hypothetical protein
MTDRPNPALWANSNRHQSGIEHKDPYYGYGLANATPDGALWGKTTAQQVVEAMPPPDCSMCDPDLLAVAPARRWFDPALDFAAGCVLALAMSLMEEPKRAGRMNWKRRMVHAKAITWAVLAWGFLALVLWASKP